MLGLIYRLTGDSTLAEDLTQETFVKVFRSLAAFDTTRRLSSWILRIAHNTAIDALRKARPGVVSLEDGVPAGDVAAPPVPDQVERVALGRALQSALAKLKVEQRAAVVLRYEDGLSFAEIGQVLGIPEVTARSHVHRARKELARLMTSAGWKLEPDRNGR